MVRLVLVPRKNCSRECRRSINEPSLAKAGYICWLVCTYTASSVSPSVSEWIPFCGSSQFSWETLCWGLGRNDTIRLLLDDQKQIYSQNSTKAQVYQISLRIWGCIIYKVTVLHVTGTHRWKGKPSPEDVSVFLYKERTEIQRCDLPKHKKLLGDQESEPDLLSWSLLSVITTKLSFLPSLLLSLVSLLFVCKFSPSLSFTRSHYLKNRWCVKMFLLPWLYSCPQQTMSTWLPTS